MLPLCEAAWMGNEPAARVLLEFGADLERPSQGQTPLMWAAKMDHPQLVRYFLSEGAEVNRVEGRWTALRFGAWSGNTEVVRILLDAGADPALPRSDEVESILHLAAEHGSGELLRLLLARGVPIADADARTGNLPLHVAALQGNGEAVAALLETGASATSPGELGRTPLHLACSGGNRQVVRLLLGAGVPSDSVDDLGLTPLHVAAQEEHDQILAMLLFRGLESPDPNVRDRRGWTPLHEAAAFGAYRCAYQLSGIQAVEIDARTSFQRTPLHLAALRGDVDVLELLLERGADPVAEDSAGETAADLLNRCTPPAVARALSGSTDPPRAVRGLDLPAWDGEAPVVSRYRSPGYTITPVSGLQLAAWDDGVVLFAPDPRKPKDDLRVGLVAPERVALMTASLVDIGFVSLPESSFVGMHASSETLSLRLDGGRYSHEWDRSLHPRAGFLEPSSIQRSFVRTWELAERVLRGYLPEASIPFEEASESGSFRGYDPSAGGRPDWTR